jgi:hypothetical protein
MKTLLRIIALCSLLSVASCSNEDAAPYSNGYYLLLDTSGTYTQELEQAKQVIHYLLAMLEPGDAFAVARIDSASFSEKDIVAKMVLDSRPSRAIMQKKDFAAVVDNFIGGVQSSPYTDISGGMLQGVEYLNEARVGNKTILIYSDLQEDLPKDYVREVEWLLDGFTVKALNVTKLRRDNQNPQVYLDRVADWQSKVIQGGGHWHLINDLEKPDALL